MLNRAIGLILDSIHRLVCGRQKNNVSETGSVSVLRWMGQDKPTQLGPLERVERASLNHRSSLRNVVVFCLPHTRRWIESKISPIALYMIVIGLILSEDYHLYGAMQDRADRASGKRMATLGDPEKVLKAGTTDIGLSYREVTCAPCRNRLR
jgi:hypothetical protein